MSTTNDSKDNIKVIDCPTCKTKVAWVQKNTYRPFCSKRCQLIDFGDWATEKNSLPVDEGFDNLSFPED